MTHWRLATEMWRARWAEGRATMTTEASSTIISWARAITARDQYRLGSGACARGAMVGIMSVVLMGVPPCSCPVLVCLPSCAWAENGPNAPDGCLNAGFATGSRSTIGAVIPFMGVLYGACVPFVKTDLGGPAS